VSDNPIHIERIVSMPFDENSYVVSQAGRDDCVVFDPGFEPDKIVDYLRRANLAPVAILCTHGHSDHIAGNSAIKDQWPECPIVIGSGDAEKLTDPQLNLSAFFDFSVTSPPADHLVNEGDTYSAAGLDFEVYDAPGHSIGHVVFIWRGEGMPVQVFGGDVLFQGGIGRTDFPDGDFEQLKNAIHQKLFPLPNDSVVYPGHGASTTIGAEKKTNSWVGAPAGYDV
jgi:hydroxyacylglutathione hydrolase